MKIEKASDKLLHVQSDIFFDKPKGFIGNPHIDLFAVKYPPYNLYPSVSMCIRDDKRVKYECGYIMDTSKFDEVIHELINWMIDHENGITEYEKFENHEIFPDYVECSRWER
jgi:hypothetical protein